MKKQRNCHFNSFFHILHEVYIEKQKLLVIEIPEWKLKAKLARNTIFKVNQDNIFGHFRSKIAKSYYF